MNGFIGFDLVNGERIVIPVSSILSVVGQPGREDALLTVGLAGKRIEWEIAGDIVEIGKFIADL